MKKLTIMLAMVAGLAQATLINMDNWVNQTTTPNDTQPAVTFTYAGENVTFELTATVGSGSANNTVWYDSNSLSVDTSRISIGENLTFSLAAIVDSGYQLDSLSFNSIRLGATGTETYDFVDNYGNEDHVTVSTSSAVFGVKGSQYELKNVLTLTKDNTALWSLDVSENGTTGTFAVTDISFDYTTSVIPEPVTLGLVSLASAGLLVVRRFRLG